MDKVNCWTRYKKNGGKYTTCYSPFFELQLRKGQPPNRTKKPTKEQLKKKKKELKDNRDAMKLRNFVKLNYDPFNPATF